MSNSFSWVSWRLGPSSDHSDGTNFAKEKIKRLPCHLAPCTILLGRKCSLLIGMWITGPWRTISSQSPSHPRNIRTEKRVWPCGWDQIDSRSVLFLGFTRGPVFLLPQSVQNRDLIHSCRPRSLTSDNAHLPGWPMGHRMNILLLWGKRKIIKRCDGQKGEFSKYRTFESGYAHFGANPTWPCIDRGSPEK